MLYKDNITMSTSDITAIIIRNRKHSEENQALLNGLKFNLKALQSKINGLYADISKTEQSFVELTQAPNADAPVRTISRSEMHLVAS
jgi:hypothetical protein